jgi:predicted dehydrogenase
MNIRIAAIGLSHNHIYNQVNALLEAGAELIAFHEADPERAADFMARYPQANRVQEIDEILEDPSIHVVASAAIPNERAPLGVRVMQHGKDYLSDKPAFVSLAQLETARQVQAETGRIYSIYFGERIGSPATVKAGELVQAGAIGQVIQTTGFGPHRLLGHVVRPEWTFDKRYFGGIINDLASHQVDQFLYFTGSTQAQVVTAHTSNVRHPQFPKMEDVGELLLRNDKASGYIRVDWLTPTGLNTWGDVRLLLLGTEGYIEIRKNCDIAGRPGDNHLFLVDQKGTHYIESATTSLPFGTQFLQDIRERTETAMPQAHCFLASELVLIAQEMAAPIRADD